MMADNEAVRLFGLSERTAPAALSLANDRSPFLASGNPIAVALKHFLRNPADYCLAGLAARKLLGKLLLERFDV